MPNAYLSDSNRRGVKAAVVMLAALMLIPAHALAQSNYQIVVQDDFGAHARGDSVFVFGSVARPNPDLRMVIQVVNPSGDLCRIEQTAPLSDGSFISESVRLSGPVCGDPGRYDVLLFYGTDRASSSFELVSLGAAEAGRDPGDVVQDMLSLVSESGIDVSEFRPRLGSSGDLEGVYVDLWSRFNVSGAILQVSPEFRAAAQAALDEGARLLESGELDYLDSEAIDKKVYAAMFKYETGDRAGAADLVSEAFSQLRQSDPAAPRPATFAELEDTLINLMTKNNTILSGPVKEDLAFVLARGTAPLFADNLADLVDMLSKSRYLEIVLRNDSSLYRLIESEWSMLSLALPELSSIDSLLEEKPSVDRLHEAAILLRHLDSVDRFLPDEGEDGDLAALIRPSWDTLSARLGGAGSVDDILDMRADITRMKDVVDISSRISRSIQIASSTGLDQGYSSGWSQMLDRVSEASSLEQVLETISEFEQSIVDLRENRSPLPQLRLEYERLRQQAQARADYESLVDIDRALRIIKSAEDTGPGTSQLERVEVLLVWASQKAPQIRASLERTTDQEADRERQADILQRIQSLDNLAELSITKNRFLPGFVEFADSIAERVDAARQKAINGNYAGADSDIRALFQEWRIVTDAYENSPRGSPSGYSLDEIKRIEYRERLEQYQEAVSNFTNDGFAPHYAEYQSLNDEAHNMLEYGNFVDAERRIDRIGQYLAEHLVLKNPDIFFDIEYDHEDDSWTISGAVNKEYNDREKLTLTVSDSDGDRVGLLEFFDTTQGTFFTKWREPVEPGLYVIMMQYRDRFASNLVHVEDGETHEPLPGELEMIEISREFSELERFMREYGGDRADNPRFEPVLASVREGLAGRDRGQADRGMDDLRLLIERYLPVRHRDAVIEAGYGGGSLELSGAVRKSVAFSEDLFVDVRDQGGELVFSSALKDDASGMFYESVVRSLSPGMHVVVLEYHDLTVTDFFRVP